MLVVIGQKWPPLAWLRLYVSMETNNQRSDRLADDAA
jgi:hypothetical protein